MTAKEKMSTTGKGGVRRRLAKVVTPVVALQCITNEGTSLPVAWTDGQYVEQWAFTAAPNPQNDVTTLDGNGSGGGMCLVSVGDIFDKKP